MSKKYTIITTYPEQGSKNIGDQLITSSLIDIIKKIKGEDTSFNILWREKEITPMEKNKIKHSDAIIFACFVIRPYFSQKEYPYLYDIIDSGVPIFLISSGTDLKVTNRVKNIHAYLTPESLKAIKYIDNKSISFGTRGLLTQSLCRELGLKKATFTGDIAFYSEAHRFKAFSKTEKVENIIVSDPHRAEAYLPAFIYLLNSLKKLFKMSRILVALHGKSPVIHNYCKENNLKVSKLYENKTQGLAVYDDADLHVGFRVHGHVSMLKRRKASYLLEQDGRGCDYGLTIPLNVSVPCHQHYFSNLSWDIVRQAFKFKRPRVLNQAPVNQVRKIMAIIENDKSNRFDKFLGLEKTIDRYVSDIEFELNKLP